jgi:hypothetical protein
MNFFFRTALQMLAVAAVLVSSAQGATPPQRQSLNVVVTKGQLSDGTKVIKMTKGDELLLNVTSDMEDELHVHGLDLRARVLPGKTTSLLIQGARTGRFPIELHHANVTIAVLEIYPS